MAKRAGSRKTPGKKAGKKKPARTARKAAAPARRTVRAKRSHPSSGTLDQRMEEFGQEMGNIGERFGKHVERKGKEIETTWNRTLGVAGPFLSSIFSVVMLAVLLWIFNFVNVPLGSGFLTALYTFLLSNIALFFAFFLFFSYSSYFHKHFRRAYLPISPIIVAIGITIGFWLLMSALNLINISFASVHLVNIAAFIQFNLFGMFIGFLFLGYLVLLVGMAMGRFNYHTGHCSERVEEIEMTKQTKKKGVSRPASGVKRLYRSGREKILGGVCGGVSEYFGVDPVLIRLLWVIFALGWGSGILAYIIAWIIIPRNPRDKKHWNEPKELAILNRPMK